MNVPRGVLEEGQRPNPVVMSKTVDMWAEGIPYPGDDVMASIFGTVNERMAATVRHNRARGSHSTQGMANMVFKMLDEGWGDADICNHLGMNAEELLRLKHVTGFSKLFENHEYRKAWKSKHQIREAKEAGAKPSSPV